MPMTLANPTADANNHLNPAEKVTVEPEPSSCPSALLGGGETEVTNTDRGVEGLSHHGDPDPEVIVLEEAPRTQVKEPRLVRAPRAPTQKEIDAHAATHLPHAEWCEFCMKGRGPNSPHKRGSGETGQGAAPSATGGAAAEPSSEEELHLGPVPKVSMDYFYVSTSSSKPAPG